MKNLIQRVLPLGVIVIALFIAWQISENPSKAKQQAQAPETRLRVNVQTLNAQTFTPIIQSYGEVKAKVSGTLVSEVAGKLVFVSPKLSSGGEFAKDETLAQVDPRLYETELVIAEGNLASANFKLEEEIALGQQAKTDWTRLGKSGEASALALRKPHLVAIKAQLKAAEAVLEQARLNLEKTNLLAPYAGKVISKYVDEGQYISANTVLADLVGSSKLEVRLPVSLMQYSFLGLDSAQKAAVPLSLSANVGTRVLSWPAQISHVENFLDIQSKQLHIVADINLIKTERSSNYIPLKIGQFVQASLEGLPISDVFVIPVGALYLNEAVYLSEQERLVKRPVSVIWRDETHAVIKDSLKEGELLITTPLGNPVTGTLLSSELTDTPKLTNGEG